jgi:hypothetical protein
LHEIDPPPLLDVSDMQHHSLPLVSSSTSLPEVEASKDSRRLEAESTPLREKEKEKMKRPSFLRSPSNREESLTRVSSSSSITSMRQGMQSPTRPKTPLKRSVAKLNPVIPGFASLLLDRHLSDGGKQKQQRIPNPNPNPSSNSNSNSIPPTMPGTRSSTFSEAPSTVLVVCFYGDQQGDKKNLIKTKGKPLGGNAMLLPKSQEFLLWPCKNTVADLMHCFYCVQMFGGNSSSSSSSSSLSHDAHAILLVENQLFCDVPEEGDEIVSWLTAGNRYTHSNLGWIERCQLPPSQVALSDLHLRLGVPYPLWHGASHCMHYVAFRDLRSWRSASDDACNVESYPQLIWQHRVEVKKCSICVTALAARIVIHDPSQSESQTYYCQQCFQMLHCDADDQIKPVDLEWYLYLHD